MEREAALALLRRHHEFPGAYEFRVVVRPHMTTTTVTAMVAGAGADVTVEDVSERKSKMGNYVALHVRLHLPEAERVLDVYEVLRSIEGILATM